MNKLFAVLFERDAGWLGDRGGPEELLSNFHCSEAVLHLKFLRQPAPRLTEPRWSAWFMNNKTGSQKFPTRHQSPVLRPLVGQQYSLRGRGLYFPIVSYVDLSSVS